MWMFDPPATSYQIRNIQILRKRLGLDEDTYREALRQYTFQGKQAESSKHLRDSQADDLIRSWMHLLTMRGETVNLYRSEKRRVASAGEIDKLRYHTIRCAIKYAPMPIYQVEVKGVNTTLSGDEMRAWCLKRWKAKAALPQNVLRQLFEDWINPKCWQFLREGTYRSSELWRVRDQNTKVLYFHQLTEGEAQYLIKRFAALQNKIDQMEMPEFEFEEDDGPLAGQQESIN